MKKVEKIKSVYEKLGFSDVYVRDDGWCMKDVNDINDELFDTKIELCTDVRPNDSTRKLFRPKELSGIENNNGWTKIEGDYIEEYNEYVWVTNKHGKIEILFVTKDYLMKDYTHYKKIKQINPPLY